MIRNKNRSKTENHDRLTPSPWHVRESKDAMTPGMFEPSLRTDLRVYPTYKTAAGFRVSKKTVTRTSKLCRCH